MKKDERISLEEIYRNTPDEHLQILAKIIEACADDIAGYFYKTLREDKESAKLLSSELVESRLKPSMARWLCSLFQPRDPQALKEFVKNQQMIGQIHARINLSPTAMSHGVSVLKERLFKNIISSNLEREALDDNLVLINRVVDRTIGLINDSYLEDIVSNSRYGHSMKLMAAGPNMALQCERVRASLFDWARKIIRMLLSTQLKRSEMPSIENTDFGLWVHHKGELIIPDSKYIAELKELVLSLEVNVDQAIKLRDSGELVDLAEMVKEIDSRVTEACWVLAELSNETMELDGGRDPLTNLFNRRFLPTVLQREVALSLSGDDSFAIALMDIDLFKEVNDTYGHDAGDAVLAQFAETLATAVRAGDFVFRYGGEEFLIVLCNVDATNVLKVANNLRERIEKQPFLLSDERRISVTSSVGIAIHGSHPDYTRVISSADKALLQAKKEGRNRCILAPNLD